MAKGSSVGSDSLWPKALIFGIWAYSARASHRWALRFVEPPPDPVVAILLEATVSKRGGSTPQVCSLDAS